jgi:hypothetical protein
MSETAEEQEGGGVGFLAEEEAMRKRHKKETGVSFISTITFVSEKQNQPSS